MKNINDGLGVKNNSDVVLKEIQDKYEIKNLTGNELKRYNMTEREVFQKYDKLSENELNSKNNKEVYVRNDVMTSVIVRY